MPSANESHFLTPIGHQRRKLIIKSFYLFISMGLPLYSGCASDPLKNSVAKLAGLARLPLLEKPLLALSCFKPGFNDEYESRILTDIADNRKLLQQIKTKLGLNQRVTVTIEHLDNRQLYVPELRYKYRIAYEKYCLSVIDYLFKRTDTKNVYHQIVAPATSLPKADANEGITAFMVHQLAQEYHAQCRFTTKNGTSARYLLKGAHFSGHMGAVEVIIESPGKGKYQIQRSNITIWQNRSSNFYNLLKLPVEETLHYLLGPYTDHKIMQLFEKRQSLNLGQARQLANDWMAVEEAVAGGIADLIIREYLSNHGLIFPVKDTRKALADSNNFSRYKYLKAGLKLTGQLGIGRTINLYKSDPGNFLKRLS